VTPEIYAPVRVTCYAGYRGEQEPRRFFPDDQEREILEIVDRWLDPQHRYFKVFADDGGTYMLRHDERGGGWSFAPLGRGTSGV
jgi:hypothetical protein